MKIYIIRIEPLCRDNEPFITEDNIKRALERILNKFYKEHYFFGNEKSRIDVMEIS